MFAITVTEKGGTPQRMDFDKPEITIGRIHGNDIVLAKGNVSKKHSRILFKDNRFIVVDLKSTNGTYVNSRKITSPFVLKAGDKIYIGDFTLLIDDAAFVADGAHESLEAKPLRETPLIERAPSFVPPIAQPPGVPPLSPDISSLNDEPLDDLPPARAPVSTRPSTPPQFTTPGRPEAKLQAAAMSQMEEVSAQVQAQANPYAVSPKPGTSPLNLATPSVAYPPQVAARVPSNRPVPRPLEHRPAETRSSETGYGETKGPDALPPFEPQNITPQRSTSDNISNTHPSDAMDLITPLLDDPSITNIIIYGPKDIWVNRGNGISRSAVQLPSRASLLTIVQHLKSSLPTHHASLVGGPLFHGRIRDFMYSAFLPPNTMNSPWVEIRKQGEEDRDLELLVASGLLSLPMADVLRNSISERQNMLLIGPAQGIDALFASLVTCMTETPVVILDHNDAPIHENVMPVSTFGLASLELQALIRWAATLKSHRLAVGSLPYESLPALLSAGASKTNGSLFGIHAKPIGDPIVFLKDLSGMAASLLPSATDIVVAVSPVTDPDGLSSLRVTHIYRWDNKDARSLPTLLFKYEQSSFASMM